MVSPKISVIIPSIRDTSLNEKCLKRQTFKNFETIIVRPISKPKKGYFYTLCADYNRGFKQAKGELIISYQDMIEIQPDTLERFWSHYERDNKLVVGAVGDQYETLTPPVKVWTDPRKRTDQGSFYECLEVDVEYTLASIPIKAIFDVGGMDEKYDKGAAVGEKEMMLRIDKAGYKSYLDQSIEYKALHHPRLTEDWDKYYKIASDMFSRHVKEIERGDRRYIDCL